LEGRVPTEFGLMQNLTILDLSNNKFDKDSLDQIEHWPNYKETFTFKDVQVSTDSSPLFIAISVFVGTYLIVMFTFILCKINRRRILGESSNCVVNSTDRLVNKLESVQESMSSPNSMTRSIYKDLEAESLSRYSFEGAGSFVLLQVFHF
jgi:hypothetical protein